MAEWFSSFAQQALKLADDIADSIVSQANEAQTQLQNEHLQLQEEHRRKEQTLRGHQQLPWETNIEARQILSDALMEKILALSLNERHFLEKSPNADEVDFNFNEYIPVVLKLLELDHNLARMHAKLSPKINEEIFWFNYYCRVSYLRSASGIDGPLAQKEAEKWQNSNIIGEIAKVSDVKPFQATIVAPPTASLGVTVKSASVHSEGGSIPDKKSTEENSGGFDDLDIDVENLKDLELDELGDINPEDFEEIGSSECMDELEAQIARELAEEKKKQKG